MVKMSTKTLQRQQELLEKVMNMTAQDIKVKCPLCKTEAEKRNIGCNHCGTENSMETIENIKRYFHIGNEKCPIKKVLKYEQFIESDYCKLVSKLTIPQLINIIAEAKLINWQKKEGKDYNINQIKRTLNTDKKLLLIEYYSFVEI
jgi:uncharacterized ubiquitin-like protein YukD